MKRRPMLSQIALRRASLPSTDAILRALDTLWPDRPMEETLQEQSNLLTWKLGEHTVAVSQSDEPIPVEELVRPCSAAWYWPEAALELQEHTSHLVVGLLPSSFDPIEAAMLLTRLVAATTMASARDALGVFWRPGGLIHAPEPFIEETRPMSRDVLPLYLWIHFAFRKEPDETHSFSTSGLEALGHLEIEVRNSRLSPDFLLQRIFNITHFVLDQGPILKDGETIGLSDDERIPIHHGPSYLDESTTVLRLEM